jgi:hypothetical protein
MKAHQGTLLPTKWVTLGLHALVGIVATVVIVAATTTAAAHATSNVTGSCSGPPVVAVTARQKAVTEVAVDLSASTTGSTLRSLYTEAAQAAVAKAVADAAMLRVVSFGPSGVGAQPVFQASFAATGDDELFNLAASNRERCLADRQVAALGTVNTRGRDRGTDVAGMLRSLITHAKSVAAAKASVTVTVITDGCQAPATVGLNRELTDVCGMLAAGKSPEVILAAHAAEFSLPDATGVTIAMRGIGVGRRPAAASTRLAVTLVGFWSTVCQHAHATACLIGSDLP